MSWIKKSDRGVILKIKVQPRAARAGLVEIKNDHLKVAVNSPPVKGEANRECLKIISKATGLSKSRVDIISGESDRYKTFLLNTDDLAAIREKIQNSLKK